MRRRVLIFLAALLLLAVLQNTRVIDSLATTSLAVVCYLLVVLPAIPRNGRR